MSSQSGPPPEHPDKPGPDQPGTDGPGTDQPGTGQAGAGQPSAGEAGAGESGERGFWSPEQPPPWGPPPQQPPPPPPGTQQPQPGAWQSPAGQPPPYPGQPAQPYGGGLPPYPSGQQPPPYPGGPYPGAPYPGGQPGWVQPGWGQPRLPRVVAAPAGEPYHRLGRNVFHRWWRPLVGTLFLGSAALGATIAVVIAWSIGHAMITGDLPEPQGTEIFPSATENLAVTLVMLGVLTPTVVLTAWLIQRRPLWSVASVLNRIRWRWLLLSCLPGVGYLALSFGLGAVVEELFPSADPAPTDDGSWVGFGRFILPAVLILLLVPFQSAAEEFVFRGWLVQAVGSYSIDGTGGNAAVRLLRTVLRTPWPALVVSSVAFVAAHGYTGWAMADIFLFAMTIGWVTIRTGGLEAAITLHTLNNVTVFLLSAATGQLDSWADQGGAPWTLLATDIPCLAFYAITVVWLAKRNEIARFSQHVS